MLVCRAWQNMCGMKWVCLQLYNFAKLKSHHCHRFVTWLWSCTALPSSIWILDCHTAATAFAKKRWDMQSTWTMSFTQLQFGRLHVRLLCLLDTLITCSDRQSWRPYLRHASNVVTCRLHSLITPGDMHSSESDHTWWHADLREWSQPHLPIHLAIASLPLILNPSISCWNCMLDSVIT